MFKYILVIVSAVLVVIAAAKLIFADIESAKQLWEAFVRMLKKMGGGKDG